MNNIRVTKWMIFALPFLGGIFQNLVSSLIAQNMLASILVSVGFFLLTIAGTIYLWRKAEIQAVLRQTRTVLTPDREKYAREGLILFVSYFTPIRGENKSAAARPKDRLRAAENCDYEFLDLEHSNFRPAIEAVVTHAAKLRHCWLISTVGKDGKTGGSRPFVPVLVKYLREVKGLTGCEFHFSHYTVTQAVDSEITGQAKDLIEAIYRRAADKKGGIRLKPKQIVIDITGGIRSLALGAFLASLSTGRSIQMVGSRYDQDGRPEGELFPMIAEFDANVMAAE